MSLGWEDLRETIGARIRAREWPPGALIPAEAQLAADYGVARATVNRARASVSRPVCRPSRRRARPAGPTACVRRPVPWRRPPVRHSLRSTVRASRSQPRSPVSGRPRWIPAASRRRARHRVPTRILTRRPAAARQRTRTSGARALGPRMLVNRRPRLRRDGVGVTGRGIDGRTAWAAGAGTGEKRARRPSPGRRCPCACQRSGRPAEPAQSRENWKDNSRWCRIESR